jgi:hypothetical protein
MPVGVVNGLCCSGDFLTQWLNLHIAANFNVHALAFLFFGCLPVFRSANYQRKWLAVGVKKVVLLFLYIYGFFLGYLTLRINSLGGKSGTRHSVPKLAVFRRLFRGFCTICAVIQPDVSLGL